MDAKTVEMGRIALSITVFTERGAILLPPLIRRVRAIII